MTATSTTEPKTERTTDLEAQREIQNALDKKRKKRKSVHVTKDVNIKHLRVDSKCIISIYLKKNTFFDTLNLKCIRNVRALLQ